MKRFHFLACFAAATALFLNACTPQDNPKDPTNTSTDTGETPGGQEQTGQEEQTWTVSGTLQNGTGIKMLGSQSDGQFYQVATVFANAGETMRVFCGKTAYGFQNPSQNAQTGAYEASVVSDGPEFVFDRSGIHEIAVYSEGSGIRGFILTLNTSTGSALWDISGLQSQAVNPPLIPTRFSLKDSSGGGYASGFEYHAGEKIKLFLTQRPELSFGTDASVSGAIEPNQAYPLTLGGNPLTLSREGRYTLLFNFSTGEFQIKDYTEMSVEETVTQTDGTFVALEGLVYAVSTRGFVLSANPKQGSSILVYQGGRPKKTVDPGDRVKVWGVKTTYDNSPEISNSFLMVDILENKCALQYLSYYNMTPVMDSYFPTEVKPISASGQLYFYSEPNTGRPYYRVAVDGASRQVDIYWPRQELLPLDGLTVNVCGFSLGYYDIYTSMMLRSVQVIDAPTLSSMSDVFNAEEGQYCKVQGTVTEVYNQVYGNFFIQDEAGTKLRIYGTLDEFGNYPREGAIWDFGAKVYPGALVTVVGRKVVYNNEVELVDVYVLASEQGTLPPPDEPDENLPGGLNNPYSASQAHTLITSGAAPSGEVYVQGIVSKIKEINTQYGNATYWITDDGQHPGDDKAALYVYRGKYLNGEDFTSQDQLHVGDKVLIHGTLLNYQGNTPEFTTGSTLYSIN